MKTEQELKMEWEKACDPDTYAKVDHRRLMSDPTCPLYPEWYPESSYELDEEKTADWWLTRLKADRRAVVEEIWQGLLKIVNENHVTGDWRIAELESFVNLITSRLAALDNEELK